MTDFHGHLDRKRRVVSFHAEEIGLADLTDMMTWLTQVQQWMQRVKDDEDGGRRWVFERGTTPTARLMVGLRAWGSRVPLVPFTARAEKPCLACNATITSGERAWKQSPKSYAGQSRARFCSRCVERGEPPRPPRLKVLRGGASE